MKRRAAIAAASAVTLAVLGGGISVAAGSGLFGNPREPGPGRLAPVLDPASVSAPLDEATAAPDMTGQPLFPTPIEVQPAQPPAGVAPDGSGDPTALPVQQAPAPAPGGTVGRDDDRHDDDSDVTGRDDDHGDDATKDDDAAEHEYEGHDDDD